MDFRLSESDREQIRATAREVFLGLVRATGEILIRIADAVAYAGHKEWIARDRIDLIEVIGGFSFIVKNGEVTGFFPSSQVNQTSDWRLPEHEVREIVKLLPLSLNFQVY